MERPVHFEIHGDDPVKASEFYSRVFGWKVSRWGEQDYWLYETGEGPGIDGASAPSQPHGQKVVLTVDVEDVDATVAKVKDAGGTVVFGKAPIVGVGWLAHVRDPNGVLIGIMEEDESAAAG